jgi:hypothetical protein
MICGSFLRLPPRRPTAAARIAGVLCLLSVALAVWAGPAAGYACDETKDTARSAHTWDLEGSRCAPAKPLHRNADPLSFLFVIGLTLGVLLIPATTLRSYTPDEED